MSFDLISNVGSYYNYILFSFLIFFVFFKIKLNKSNKLNNEFASLTLEDSNLLKGFFILIVIFHHIYQRVPDSILKMVFNQMGYLSVAVFFFLSGFGLIKSIKCPVEGFIGFSTRKLIRIYFPCVIANFIFFPIFSGDDYSLLIFNPVFFDSSSWFVISLLYFYFIFYFNSKFTMLKIYGWLIGYLIYLSLILIYDLGYLWFVSSLCFVFGVYVGQCGLKLACIVGIFSSRIKTCCLFVFFILLFVLKTRFSYVAILASIFFCFFVFSFLQYYSVNSKLLSFLGGISLEIYIIHMKLLWVFENYVFENEIVKFSFGILFYFIALLLSSIILRYFYSRLCWMTYYFIRLSRGLV
jgi:probable poly-beta-1,6-N-acetyl-D-glucosamine export protein